jgi:hypothetical protein
MGDVSYQVLVGRRSGLAYATWGKPTYQTQKQLPKGAEAWKEARFIVIQTLRESAKGQEQSSLSAEFNVLPQR